MSPHSDLVRLVTELVSTVTEPRVRPHNDGQTGMFICARGGLLSSTFYDFGPYIMRKNAATVAREIALELKR